MMRHDFARAINAHAGSKGFSCVTVSWEDSHRFLDSCWGNNISDVTIRQRNGQLLYTLRSQNFNERLEYVSAKDIDVVVGNYIGSSKHAITLEEYLRDFWAQGNRLGVPHGVNLYNENTDTKFSIRFQTVFLPMKKKTIEKTFCQKIMSCFCYSADRKLWYRHSKWRLFCQ